MHPVFSPGSEAGPRSFLASSDGEHFPAKAALVNAVQIAPFECVSIGKSRKNVTTSY